jgi:hypothetical protein
MPLLDGYGVLIGTLHHFTPDPVEGYGDYYHLNVDVLAPRGVYRCKVDLDAKTPAGLLWRVVELRASSLQSVRSLPDGWHDLERRRGSGALDYIRSQDLHPELSPSYAVIDPALEAIRRALRARPRWRRGTTQEVLADLTALLADSRRLFVFGEPFSRGRGVHNVHQNQGDPKGSKWAGENGIWQDGALIAERDSGALFAYLAKYATQADRTDKRGHPA